MRNLASKSAEAAKNTTRLIDQTVDTVEEGISMAQDTAASMLSVVEQASKINELIIADYSSKQASATEEVIHGIEQISETVQSNMGTVEKSASASEELSGQASVLRELVAGFRLQGQ